jgi:hypothetical protein
VKRGIAILLILAGLMVGLRLWMVSTSSTRYPRDIQGWSNRWAAGAAEVGRTPGLGWDDWAAAAGQADRLMTDAGPEMGVRLAALDWPETVTPPFGADAAGPADWSGVAAALAAAITDAAKSGDAEGALRLAQAARRIERGVGVTRGVAGAIQRFGFGSTIDRAVIAALSGGIFTVGTDAETAQRRLDALLGLAVDDGGFAAEWSLVEQREFALRAGVEADLSGDDLRFIDHLFYEMDQARRGRDPMGARSGAMLDRLRAGERPGVAEVVGDLDGFVAGRRAARAGRVGLLVMVALERHRSRTGAYPASLADLAPVDLPRVPVDPWGFGEDFGYALVDPDASAPAAGYRLWSMGPDRQDDGGDPAADLVFNPSGQEATP